MLGGGGITGAAYEMAALMAIELATGWTPNRADVVIGTSSGSFVAALVRNQALSLDSLVMQDDERGDVADRIRSHVYSRGGGVDVKDWVRHGLVPGVRKPGLTMFLGSPARYQADGLARWVETQIGPDAAGGWPDLPTAIVAHDLRTGQRVAFGTDGAPTTSIADAVAASSAIPILFRPYPIGEAAYVDGGVSSGTHADLVVASPKPLDLVIILAPMAAETQRKRAKFHEKMFDRVGSRSLQEEVDLIKSAWPDTDVLVLSPSPSIQNAARPNPMDPSRSVPTFMRTLIAMKRTLATPEVWSRLDDHLSEPKPLKLAR